MFFEHFNSLIFMMFCSCWHSAQYVCQYSKFKSILVASTFSCFRDASQMLDRLWRNVVQFYNKYGTLISKLDSCVDSTPPSCNINNLYGCLADLFLHKFNCIFGDNQNNELNHHFSQYKLTHILSCFVVFRITCDWCTDSLHLLGVLVKLTWVY